MHSENLSALEPFAMWTANGWAPPDGEPFDGPPPLAGVPPPDRQAADRRLARPAMGRLAHRRPGQEESNLMHLTLRMDLVHAHRDTNDQVRSDQSRPVSQLVERA
jgi:hypothetical protein